jgi:hypothetical protein
MKKEVMFSAEKPIDREKLMEASAFKIEEQSVRRAFVKEQMDVFKDELTACSIDLRNKEAAAANTIKALREEIRTAREATQDRVTKLQLGYEEAFEKVYLFDDQENSEISVFDKFGNLIGSRPLLPMEKQTSIVSIGKTGTHE